MPAHAKLGTEQVKALVIAALRKPAPAGAANWTITALDKACSGAGIARVKAAVQSLRYAGKIDFNTLALSASMRLPEDEPPARDADARSASDGDEGAGRVKVAPSPAGEVIPVSSPATSSLASGEARALLIQVEAYCARTGMAEGLFGRLALSNPHPGYVGLLRKRLTAKKDTAAAVRDFMRRWPEGCTVEAREAERRATTITANEARAARSLAAAPGHVDIAAEVEAETRQRAAARSTAKAIGSVSRLPAPVIPLPDRLQAGLLEDMEDGFRFLRRKWPDLLEGVLSLARDEGMRPGPMFARIVEAGIFTLREDGREVQ